MKRKRPDRHDQSLKEQENPSSTKSFRSNITGKLQTLFNGFVSELQSISEDKRQDVALLFSPKYKESNCTDVPSAVKSAFPSLANSSDSTKVLQNFIDSAKSRISGLLSSKPESEFSGGNNLLKNLQSSAQPKTKSLSIDPLEIQINLKFQSLLFKAFDTKKANHVSEKQDTITEKDWQDLSRMLQDFSQSAKKKLHASLTKERNTQFLIGSVSNQNSTVKESLSSGKTHPSLVSQRKSQNKELQNPSVNQGNSTSHHLGTNSSKLTRKNTKLLKMDFSSESTDSSNSPRNPFDEGCMLLLSDAEKCPNYVELHLSSDSDTDEPEDVGEPPESSVHQAESEDEVIVLGEKSKTYQEVTLEEDDDGEVRESVIEKVVEKCPVKEREVEEVVFNCPKCDKSFRVQSLLQFHIKMHTAESPSSNTPENHCPNSSSSSDDESSSETPRNLNQRQLDICLYQDALVSQKNLGLNGEFESLEKVKEASKFTIKCDSFPSEHSTMYQEFLSSNDKKGFLRNNQIDHLSALCGRVSSYSDKSPESLNVNNSSSDEKSFRKGRAFKPSSNHEHFALKDVVVSPRASSSFGEGRFLGIERCPDYPNLSMIYDWKSLNLESSFNNVNKEYSLADEKNFGECSKSSKCSANFEKLSSEGATYSVLDSTHNRGFLSNEKIERCPDYPNLSMVFDWGSLNSKNTLNTFRKCSKSSTNFENLSSEAATFSVLDSTHDKGFLSNENIERCPENPDLSMVYDFESLGYEKNPNTSKEKHLSENERRFGEDKVSKSIYNNKNFASADVSNFRGEVGFLEGRIERCPENPDLSMVYDFESLGYGKNPNTLKEEHSSENKRRFGKDEISKSIYNDKNFASADADQKVPNFGGELGFLEGRIEHCPENPDVSMLYDWESSDSNTLSCSNTINGNQPSNDENYLKQNNESPNHSFDSKKMCIR